MDNDEVIPKVLCFPCPTDLRITKAPTNIQVPEGSTAHLPCVVSGDNISIGWSRYYRLLQTLGPPWWYQVWPLCLQNRLNPSCHRFNMMLETFIRGSGPYGHVRIKLLVKICQLSIHNLNLQIHQISKVLIGPMACRPFWWPCRPRVWTVLFADDVVRLGPSCHDLQCALGWFTAKCKVVETTISSSKSDANRKKIGCSFWVEDASLPRVRVLVFWRVFHEWW